MSTITGITIIVTITIKITIITIITGITWVIIMLSASSGGAMAQSWISPLAKIA